MVLVYCGYIGGSLVDRAYGIAVDSTGRAYVTGGSTSTDLPVVVGPDLSSNGNYDAFVARVNAAGTATISAPRSASSRKSSGNRKS